MNRARLVESRVKTRGSLIASLFGVAIAAFLYAACGGDGGSDTECGVGTVLDDGVCVATIDVCGPGTVADANGDCVPSSEACGDNAELVDGVCVGTSEGSGEPSGCMEGEVLLGGDCIAVACPDGEAFRNGVCTPIDGAVCGTGTTLMGTECVPNEDLCDPGLVYVAGECRAELGCGAGTIEVGGQCVPVENGMPDMMEALEPNDQWFGTPTSITLPAVGSTLTIGGSIGAPLNLDGDEEMTLEPDFDTYVFDGTAGQRVQIEATAVGLPSAAVYIEYDNSDVIDAPDFVRFAIPVGTRNAMREVVLPFTGRYRVTVGDRTNLVDWFGLEADMFGGWEGADTYTYLLAVTTVTNPQPMAQASETLDSMGDATALPQFRFDLPAGTLVELEIAADDPDVDVAYWVSSADYSEYLGEFTSGTHAVPAGGLLVTVDYGFAAATNTGFTLTGRPVGIIFVGTVDSTASVNYTGVSVGSGGERFYRITVPTPIVLAASVVPSAGSSANMMLEVQDEALRPLGQSNTGGGTRSIHIALDPGTYHVVPIERNEPGLDGTFTFDLSLNADALQTMDVGSLTAATPTLQVVTNALATAGAEQFYTFTVDEIGDFSFEAQPPSSIDIGFELFLDPVLARGGSFSPDQRENRGGQGAVETYSRTLGDLRYFVRAYTPSSLGPGDVRLLAQFATNANLTGETEPNNTLAQANDIGVISDSTTTISAELLISEMTVADAFRFTVETPSRVRLRTSRLNAFDADTILRVYNSVGELLAEDTSGGFSSLEIGLEPGNYFAEVVSGDGRADNPYLLTLQVILTYDACVPSTDTCIDQTINRCNGGGTTLTTIPCVDGCMVDDGAECSARTESEPNDNSDSANDIGLLSDGRTVVEAAIEDRGLGRDVDWYRIGVTQLTNLTIGTTNSEADGPAYDTNVTVYAAGDLTTPLAMDDNSGSGNFSRISNLFIDSGNYFIVVEYPTLLEPPLAGPYRLFIDAYETICLPSIQTCNGNDIATCNSSGTEFNPADWTCAGMCALYDDRPGCDHETENESMGGPRNDSAGTAQMLSGAIGRSDYEGSIDGGSGGVPDVDWYRFDLIDQTSVRVDIVASLLTGGPVDTQLAIYRAPDFATPVAQTSTIPNTIRTTLGPGTYAVRVSHVMSTPGITGPYRMVLQIDPPLCVTGEGVCQDANTVEFCTAGVPVVVACDVPCGTDGPTESCDISSLQSFPGSIDFAAEVDSYAFTADAGQTIRFQVSPVGADSRLFLCRYGDAGCAYDGDSLALANQGGGGSPDQIDYTFTEPGAYEIRVSFWLDATGMYTLNVNPL